MALTEKLTAIGDALRQALGVAETFTLGQMPQKVEQVYDAGRQAQYRQLWDNIAVRTQKYMFAGPAWNVNTFFPDKSFTFSGALTDYMFALHGVSSEPYDLEKRLADCGVRFDFSRITLANYTFYGCNLTRLPFLDLSGCTRLTSTFHNSQNLHTLCLRLGENTAYNRAFDGCVALEHVTVEGTIGQSGLSFAACPLTRESLLSIVDALKDGVSGLTVTLGESNLAKLTEEEKAAAREKGWTLQ